MGPAERYVIVEYLAEGGMGAIYLGKRIGVGGFEKQVVLKQLLPEFSSDPQITELFLQEARLSASLDHQSIVYTLDLVQVAGSYYMVMEYVRGGDLRSLLRRAKRRGARFSPAAALLIGRELSDALHYVHKRKLPDGKPLSLIHRDISPSNILLSTSGEVKLTDFGIAKASTYENTTYKIRGKVGYMSPEQARGEEIDARSDLFSLAVVLYEVLCGERLFIGNLTQSPALVYGAPILPPSHFCENLPEEFDQVMLKALSLPREGRYQTALSFEQALLEVGKRHDLLIGHAELSAHLREICGPDPDAWLRDEDRTGTAMIAPGEGDEDDDAPPRDDDEAPFLYPRNSRLLSKPEALPDIAGETSGEMTEPTSLMASSLVEVLRNPPMEETQPIERQPTPDDPDHPASPPPPPVNIAAMARKMLPMRSRDLSGPPGRQSPTANGQRAGTPLGPPLLLRDDDTAAVTAPRPATVRTVVHRDVSRFAIAQVEADPPSLSPEGRAFHMTRSGILFLSLLIVLLLGLGIALGMLLSNPRLDSGEPHPPQAPSPEAPPAR